MVNSGLQNVTPKKEDREYQERIWYSAFLASFREYGNVRFACEAAGISRTTAYRTKEADPEFARLWDEAREDAADYLEAAAAKRALEYSDTLMIFLLKATRPEKYRERHDITLRTVKADKPVYDMTDQELAEYERNLRG